MNKKFVTHLYDECADEIRDAFSSHGRLMIKSPTGTGKTYLLKNFAVEYGAIILVPTIDMLDLYAGNEITKVTSKCCTSEYNPFHPCVMVWDTAVILSKTKIGANISDRVWFVDEPHSWFDDRRYRQSAVDTMIMAREVKQILCVSATPSGEVEELGLHLLKYYTRRSLISTDIALTAKPEAYISTMIRQARKTGRKCAVLSDQYASSLYNYQYYIELDRGVQLLHSDERGKRDYERVLHYEGNKSMFLMQTTICTRIVEMGFNFMNAEPMFVIVHLNLGEHTANRIIQFVGRLRRCNNIRLLVVVDTRSKGRDILQDAKDNYIVCDITEGHFNLKEEVASRSGREYSNPDPEQIFACKRIQDYVNMHSSIKMIADDLKAEGYFGINGITQISDDNLKCMKDERRKKSECEFRQMLEGCDFSDDDVNRMDEYQKEWYREYMELSNAGFDLREFMLSGFTKCKDIDNIIHDAHTILRVGEFFGDSDGFEREYDYKRLNGINPAISMQPYRMLQQVFSRCHKYHDLMKECGSVAEYYDACINGAVAKNKMASARKSEGGSKGGQKAGKRNAAKRITIRNKHNGVTESFDSAADAMERIGCSTRATFSKFLKVGGTKFNRDWEIIL